MKTLLTIHQLGTQKASSNSNTTTHTNTNVNKNIINNSNNIRKKVEEGDWDDWTDMMERRPRVWRKEKLAGSGKPERKMPLSTMAKLRGGMKRSSPSSATASPATVWSEIVSWIWRHMGVVSCCCLCLWWRWWVRWSSAASCISKFEVVVYLFVFKMRERKRGKGSI